MIILLIVIFILFLALGFPIASLIGFVSFTGMAAIPEAPTMIVFQKMFNSLNSFVLLSVPLFILAASIMNRGKISKMLIDFTVMIFGFTRGGLAHANVLVSMIFAGVSGSAQADTSGIGKILIPSMIDSGYDKETSVGVTAASSTIGIIIPPSIPMVIYSGITNTSVAAMFLCGIVPGILIGLAMMLVIALYSKKKNFPKYDPTPIKDILRQGIKVFPALLTPVIIVGGILTGWYTPTEAAAFASIYALFISLFIYKTITLKDLIPVFQEVTELISVSLFALTTASALGELMAFYNFHQHISAFFQNNVTSPIIFLLIVIAFFLFLGTFMDLTPAMILFIPVLYGPAINYGIHPVHLGIISVITLAIGLCTPPYGICLLIASSIGELSVVKSIKGTMPYLLAMIAVLLLITFFPEIMFALPRLIQPQLFA